MANVKTTSYIDAVNRVARDAMVQDLAEVLMPLREVITNLSKISMNQSQLILDLRERIERLERGEGSAP
jgi:hypothetical protein